MRVAIASKDKWATHPSYKGVWFYYALYDFGQGLTVKLFDNARSADWFRRTRVKHDPVEHGRVKFK